MSLQESHTVAKFAIDHLRQSGTMFKSINSEMELHSYPEWAWVNHLMSLILSFLICEMEVDN